MSEQTSPQKTAVVGEDGELIQPDTTVNPDAYGEYVATYVRRDPLLFQLRRHIKEWKYLYCFVMLIPCCSLYGFIPLIGGYKDSGIYCLYAFIGTIILIVGFITLFRYLITLDIRQ